MSTIAIHKPLSVYRPTMLVVYRAQKQYDPTKTSALREAFVRDMTRRFKELIRTIKEAIVDDDIFGLNKDTNIYARATQASPKLSRPGRKAFQFLNKEEKVTAFMEWLKEQEKAGLLQTTKIQQVGKSREEAWTNLYIQDSYKRGVQRARYEMRAAGVNIPSLESTGGIAGSLPFHLDRIGMLYTRTFEELKGISAAMDTQISRVLSQAMVDGDGPAVIARKLVATISGDGDTLAIKDSLGRFIPAMRRAKLMARTEVIRSHHQATIQEYKNWALEGVVVKAEWRTAGDDRVCPLCAERENKIYTLDEAETLIPLHPGCRCIALPAIDEEKTFKQ